MRTALLTITIFLALPGCMRALQGHALDHAIQTDTIARRCRTPVASGGYAESPCSDELQRDADRMAQQAECVLAVSEGRECEETGQ